MILELTSNIKVENYLSSDLKWGVVHPVSVAKISSEVWQKVGNHACENSCDIVKNQRIYRVKSQNSQNQYIFC